MNEKERIEAEIRELLKVDSDAVTLSNKLYGQGTGLFVVLARTIDDRKQVVESDLWKVARSRLRELEERDLIRFREVVQKVEEHRAPGTYVLRLDSANPLASRSV